MNKTKQILILAIIAAVGAAVGMIVINQYSGSSVQANQGGEVARRNGNTVRLLAFTILIPISANGRSQSFVISSLEEGKKRPSSLSRILERAQS
jgi:hypothetical protein